MIGTSVTKQLNEDNWQKFYNDETIPNKKKQFTEKKITSILLGNYLAGALCPCVTLRLFRWKKNSSLQVISEIIICLININL